MKMNACKADKQNTKEQKRIHLQFSDYEQKGLYLLFENSPLIKLTEKEIENISQKFWEDTTKITPEVRKATDFKLCPICPEKEQEGICYALHPVLPLLEIIDRYVSFDKVTAIYKGDDKNLLYVSDSTMSSALQYISILSLMYYCRVGRKYWRYYLGVNPLMGAIEARNRLYLNIYWLHKGNLEEIEKAISEFKQEIRITSESQIKRMYLICKNDVFMNAFANTHIAAEILSLDMEKALKESFTDFDTV